MPEVSFEVQLSGISNSTHVEYIRLARKRVLLLLELSEAEGWKELGSKQGVSIYNKSMEHGIKAVMGRGKMPFSVKEVSRS